MYLPLSVGVLCLSLFCYALLCVNSSFAIILKRKRKLVALLFLSYRSCIVTINVLWLFLTVPWVGLQYAIVVFPDHTHLLIGSFVVFQEIQTSIAKKPYISVIFQGVWVQILCTTPLDPRMALNFGIDVHLLQKCV